jgi:hypothetical protein
MKIRMLISGLMMAIIGASWGAVYRENADGQKCRWVIHQPVEGLHTNVVNPLTHAIRIFLGTRTFSVDNHVAELNAIRASFDQWQALPGHELRFEHAGTAASGLDVNLQDHTNLVCWALDSVWVNGGLDNISGSLGLTYTRQNQDNALLETDIVLNGMEFEWFTDIHETNTAARFIEGIVTHEVGHLLGLLHSPVGGTTLFPRGTGGVNSQAGLSLDELCAMRVLYPQPGVLKSLGALHGTVTRQGNPVWGAVVILEDESGNLVSGGITQSNGQYSLQAIPPGVYQARVSPLDPSSAAHYLCRGQDIVNDPEFKPESSFLPSTNTPFTLSAGLTVSRNFVVAQGEPAFRVNRILRATAKTNDWWAVNAPTRVLQGDSNILVGVFGERVPTKGAALQITGTGIAAGPASFHPAAIAGLNLITVMLQVRSNAAPGLRSFLVHQGTNIAWANGCLEIAPRISDDNFDGLDDEFQRAYFPLFTAAEAAPGADPDGDGLTNAQEHWVKTDPTDADSVLKIDRIELAGTQVSLAWRGQRGFNYQVMSSTEPSRTAATTESPSIAGIDTEMHWTMPLKDSPTKYYWIALRID